MSSLCSLLDLGCRVYSNFRRYCVVNARTLQDIGKYGKYNVLMFSSTQRMAPKQSMSTSRKSLLKGSQWRSFNFTSASHFGLDQGDMTDLWVTACRVYVIFSSQQFWSVFNLSRLFNCYTEIIMTAWIWLDKVVGKGETASSLT